MNPNDYDVELHELAQRSTGRLLASETFDRAAFEALKQRVCAKSDPLRAEHVISKQLLGSLRDAAKAIRNQAPYVAAAQANLGLADEFEMVLDLLIAGEACSDRVPGIPRII
jgi:hypothetical protein